MSTSSLSRVVRRETHSPRTVAMIIAVVILILALTYAALEIILSLAGQPALLVGPAAAFGWVVGLPTEVPAGVTITAGIVIALLGLVCIVLALAPGRLSKHEMQWGERRAVVADNGVIAAAIAQRVSDELFVARGRVRVGVGHRVIDVSVTPEAGIEMEKDRVRVVVDSEIEEYRLRTKPRVSVRVNQQQQEATP
ncbi:DUF6286 domain-containing protein [Leucobacter musarum]|uniref:DUF6286 domain-containing protein n=1 Tax=Leucobacter musarum TaxID=1930747 RepID=UPI0006A7AD8A|nr:DUF6286 domain-containing protein [Leucobacter musarum]